MMLRFEPKIKILPTAQRELWPELSPAHRLSFVLYGGTAVALYLGHRTSVDFDFFRSQPLDKGNIERILPFVSNAKSLQEDRNTLVISVEMPSGSVKVSFFGGINFGRLNDPLQTSDGVLLVASKEDLLATKLKAILDRAEAKDYADIVALLNDGVSLERALAAFARFYGKDPILPLKAMGFFEDGDLASVSPKDRDILCAARDGISSVPQLAVTPGSLAGDGGA